MRNRALHVTGCDLDVHPSALPPSRPSRLLCLAESGRKYRMMLHESKWDVTHSVIIYAKALNLRKSQAVIHWSDLENWFRIRWKHLETICWKMQQKNTRSWVPKCPWKSEETSAMVSWNVFSAFGNRSCLRLTRATWHGWDMMKPYETNCPAHEVQERTHKSCKDQPKSDQRLNISQHACF